MTHKVSHLSAEDAFLEATFKADKLFLLFLWAHIPFAGFVLSYSFGTWREGLVASTLVAIIGTLSYFFSKGTLAHRILNGLLLMTLSVILISIQYGRIEMHFHVFATLPFLLIYKDWRVYPLSALLIALQHATFNYCQSKGITLAGFPLIVFNYGNGWNIVFLHIGFVIVQVSVLMYYSKSLKNQFMLLSQNNEILNRTVEEKTFHLKKEIEKRKLSEENLIFQKRKLLDSNQELEQFAYVASHDLQEPLRMISSYLRLIEKRYKDKLDADGSEFIHFAIDGAQRMSKMIASLLEYSRVGRQKVNVTKIKLDDLINQVLKNLKVRIQESNAEIKCDGGDFLFGDHQLVERLFQNIIGNALKFVPKDRKPKVEIKLKDDNDQIILSVADNGIGIPKRELESVFHIFKRLHSTKEYKGTGIGLSICKKIVSSHGGRIWIESEEGIGTKFFISLPKVINDSVEQKVA